jgi:hypothetical protein
MAEKNIQISTLVLLGGINLAVEHKKKCRFNGNMIKRSSFP